MTCNKTIEYVLLLTSVCCLFLAAAPAKAAKISELTETAIPNLSLKSPSWDGVSPNGTTRIFSIRNLIKNNNIVTSNYVGEVTLTTLNATDLVISGATSLSTLTLTGEATIPTINTVDIVSSRLASLATLTLSGEATIPTLNSVDIVSSRLASLATLTVSGEATLPTINAVNIIATGETLLEELLVTGEAVVATLNAIDITASGEVSFASLDVSGEATVTTLNVTDLVVSGIHTPLPEDITLNSLAVTGASTLQATSTTALNVSGNANVTGDMTVNGKYVNPIITEWTAWTPWGTANNSDDIIQQLVYYAKYKVVGNIVFYTMYVKGRIRFGNATEIYYTVPTGVDVGVAGTQTVGYFWDSDGRRFSFSARANVANNRLELRKEDYSTFSQVTAAYFYINGWYIKL